MGYSEDVPEGGVERREAGTENWAAFRGAIRPTWTGENVFRQVGLPLPFGFRMATVRIPTPALWEPGTVAREVAPNHIVHRK